MDNVTPVNKLDVQRAFEAIAHIIGKRENVEIIVKSIQRVEKEKTEEETA